MIFNFNILLRERVKFFNLKKRAQFNVKKNMFYSLFFFVEIYLKTLGLQFKYVELVPYNEEAQLEFDENELNLEAKQAAFKLFLKKLKILNVDTSDKELAVLQNAKDKANLSLLAYRAFRIKLKYININILSAQKLDIFKLKLNLFFPIFSNSLGCYVSAGEKIKFVISKIYHQLIKNNQEIKNNTFNVHLNGDGCQITKTKINIIKFTFKILNENNNSITGQYHLGNNHFSIFINFEIDKYNFFIKGIFRVIKEDYETISKALKEIIEDLQDLQTVKINDIDFDVKYTLGGDLKWIALITGINAANADYPCPWCKFNKKSDNDLRKDWNLRDRSHQESKENQNSFGYINQPMFKFIKFEEIVVDNLHLLLRITDVIFEKLITFIEHLDSKNRDSIYFKRLTDFLIGLKITSPFYISKKGTTKMRNLNQNERLIFLEAIRKKNFKEIFYEKANDKKLIMIDQVFLKFNELFHFSKNDFSENNITFQYNENYFKTKLNEWLGFFIQLMNYDDKKRKKKDIEYITPYIHIMVQHLPEFISTYKNLNLFSTQALEKSHNSTKINLMRQTNKKTNEFIKQLLEKENRMEFYNLNGTTTELFEKIKI